MFEIYTGREYLDKNKFMFDRVKARLKEGKHVILIVPDQFTLQAEKDAFSYLRVRGLLDFEVLSFSRLANRVLAEVGGGNKVFINNYGKYMMLSRILLGENENLKVFKGFENSSDFVEKINNFISEIKNHNISPDELMKIVEEEDSGSLLSRKLEDIHRIYLSYEERMGEEQIDTADFLSLFIQRIKSSNLVRTSEFWISGFDYLTPKNVDAVLTVAETSSRVSMVLTAETKNNFFKNTNLLAEKLRNEALKAGLDAGIREIPQDYAIETESREPLAHLEAQFCKATAGKYPHKADKNIELVAAANYYAEAETAAAGITELIRDKGMRYRDILVICNDMETRASIIKRVFSEYGLPVFIDQRRGIHHNPALEYIAALMEIATEGWKPDLIFKLLKTGLTELSDDEIEELENYAVKFKIIGSKWEKNFKLTAGEYSEDELNNLNRLRDQIVRLIKIFVSDFRKAVTVKEKTEKLFDFLNEKARLPARIDEHRVSLEEQGNLEYAEEMSQVWAVILNIFDQFVDILGDEILSYEEYSVVLKTGLESIQIGMLPPSVDQILLGTMQRTRAGDIKALFVVGANDGVLPAYSGEETLLNEDERSALYQKEKIICRNDDQVMNEEQMSIYRNLSKPSHYLFMSYSVSDIEGGEIRSSLIFEKIRKMFPEDMVKKDILNREDEPLSLVQSRGSTVNHLADALRKWMIDDFIPDIWRHVLQWYEQNEPEVKKRIVDGLSFRNNREKINKKYISDMYKLTDVDMNDKILSSPSGLENFSRCPFSFFMGRGIGLKERRLYESDSRDIGDIYHETLMKFGRIMCEDGLKPMDPNSKWHKISHEECETLVSDIYDSVEDVYNEGLLKENKYERYKSGRYKRIIIDTAMEIRQQVKAGKIESMLFETEFGKDKYFKPITVTRDGKTVEIRGKIDRIDILEGGYSKIIDYKSGAEELVVDDIMSGWQLQLMIYLNAVTDSRVDLKPAGIFYFKIPEPHVEMDGMSSREIKEKIWGKMSGEYRMDGMVINDRNVVESITGDLSSGASKIISAKKDKENENQASGKAVVDKEFFDIVKTEVSSIITHLCEDILAGEIKAEPKESKKKKISACTYCDYRGICNYDKFFE